MALTAGVFLWSREPCDIRWHFHLADGCLFALPLAREAVDVVLLATRAPLLFVQKETAIACETTTLVTGW